MMRCSFVQIVVCIVLCVALVEGNDFNSNQGGRVPRGLTRSRRSLSYNYYDEMALGTCGSLPRQGGWVLAVRRRCGEKVTCATICSAHFMYASNPAARPWINRYNWGCIESLHVYQHHPHLPHNHDSGVHKLGVYLYRYNSCNAGGCGPNYCCCYRRYK